MRRHGLHRKILLTVVPFLAVSLIAVATLCSGLLHSELNERFRNRLEVGFDGVQLDIAEVETSLHFSCQAISSSAEFRQHIVEDNRQELLKILQEAREVIGLDEALLFAPDGRVLASGLRFASMLSPEIGNQSGRAPEAKAPGVLVTCRYDIEHRGQVVAALQLGRRLGHQFVARVKKKYGLLASVFDKGRIHATTFVDQESIAGDSMTTLVKSVSTSGKPITSEMVLSDTHFLVKAATLGSTGSVMVLALSTESREAAARRLYLILAAVVAVILISSGFLMSRGISRIVDPIRQLSGLADQVARGRLDQELPTSSKDEVGELVESFNRMTRELKQSVTSIDALYDEMAERKRAEAKREEIEQQLIQSQKMEALGLLAGGVAHDFNNLLTVIRGNCDLLTDVVGPEHVDRDCLEEIRDASLRAVEMTQHLLSFSRQQETTLSLVEPKEQLDSIRRLLDRLVGDDVHLELEIQEGIWPLVADRGQLDQVITNLVVNAREAMPKGGVVAIAVQNSLLEHARIESLIEIPPGEYVEIRVTDTGSGIAPEVVPHIFEPFYSTKRERNGTGLGLATSYGNVRRAGGYLTVSSEPGHGATFRIYLRRFVDTASLS